MLLHAEPMFQFAENFFCTYFLMEYTIRAMAFRNVCDGFGDSWFNFDGVLVIFSVFETWIFNIILLVTAGGGVSGGLGDASLFKLVRLCRLSRMARMAKLFRAMPELMIMIKGMTVAMRSVFFTLCLLVCIVYVFAIAFVQLMGPNGALQPLSSDWTGLFFPSVSQAMVTLLLGGTMPDEAALFCPLVMSTL